MICYFVPWQVSIWARCLMILVERPIKQIKICKSPRFVSWDFLQMVPPAFNPSSCWSGFISHWFPLILLVEEIRRSPPGIYKSREDNGINYQPQLVGRFFSINSMAYFEPWFLKGVRGQKGVGWHQSAAEDPSKFTALFGRMSRASQGFPGINAPAGVLSKLINCNSHISRL